MRPLGIDVPVAPSPALLVRLTAATGVVKTLVASPEVEVREGADGALLAAVDHRGESTREELARTAQRTLDRVSSMFDGADGAQVASAHIGWRPMPGDEEPIIGPVVGTDGLYLTVMHSGVTLAPVAGRLAAEEIVNNIDAPELQGCRPARFARTSHRRS